jgi:hypothetical protein
MIKCPTTRYVTACSRKIRGTASQILADKKTKHFRGTQNTRKRIFCVRILHATDHGKGDQMRLRQKIAPNVAQPIFRQTYCITFTTVKRSPKILATFVIFKKSAQTKRLTNCNFQKTDPNKTIKK